MLINSLPIIPRSAAEDPGRDLAGEGKAGKAHRARPLPGRWRFVASCLTTGGEARSTLPPRRRSRCQLACKAARRVAAAISGSAVWRGLNESGIYNRASREKVRQTTKGGREHIAKILDADEDLSE